MARGLIRLYSKSSTKDAGIFISNGSKRWIYTHITRNLLQKEAAVEKTVQGVPYTKLTIGVPKEIWKDERRLEIYG